MKAKAIANERGLPLSVVQRIISQTYLPDSLPHSDRMLERGREEAKRMLERATTDEERRIVRANFCDLL